MNIHTEQFGTLNGQMIYLFTLENDQGVTIQITNYGGIVTSILTPDSQGKTEDIVLGFDRFEDYLQDHPYIGAIIGRYANRIAYASFNLNDEEIKVTRNHGQHHIHGGDHGFDKQIWEAKAINTPQAVGVDLTYLSEDGEEGFPGNLTVNIKYTLNNRNEIIIEYTANTDKATHVNLTNHSYFNLSAGKDNILQHEVQIYTNKVTEVNEELIPTGRVINIENTPLDFRYPKTVGRDIANTADGYDHNYVLNNADQNLIAAASVTDPLSGRSLDVYTTQPGMQFFSGNNLDGSLKGKNGIRYNKYDALCLETQHYPDTPNHPEFPSTLVEPQKPYYQFTKYKLGTT